MTRRIGRSAASRIFLWLAGAALVLALATAGLLVLEAQRTARAEAERVTQAVAATLTGLVLMAILLRSGSLWAAILYHGLWNLTAFLVAHDPTRTAGAVTPEPWMLWVPVAFLVPNGLYAFWLLRGIGRTPPPGDFAGGRR